MAKLTLSDITTLTTPAIATINANSAAIETALENTLSRNGTSPNSMGADLDLNGNDLLNVGNLYLNGEIIESDVVTEYVDFQETTEPSSPSSNTLRAYVKDVSGVSTLFTKDSTGRLNVFDNGFYDAREYGLGDGSTTNAAAINAAITAANGAGGGTVYVPPGTFSVVNTGTSECVVLKSNVRLMGAGRDATVLTLANAQNSQVVQASSVSNVAIENMGINGNRANQTAQVHGIRLAETIGCQIKNVKIINAFHYGIGAQSGTLRNILIDDVYIQDVGGDGIDFKNTDDDNQNIIITNVIVNGWGLNDAETSIQAGIDIRGPALLSNIALYGATVNDVVGIRFRNGELLETNGLGGHNSCLVNFYIDNGTTNASFGVHIVARGISVSNGHIVGGFRGLVTTDSESSVSNVKVNGVSDEGFIVEVNGSGLDGHNAVFSNCSAQTCGDRCLVIAANNCTVLGFVGIDSDEGIIISSGATNTRIIGGLVNNNTTANFSDAGTDTTVIGLSGVADSINQGTFTITDDDAGAAAGPILNLYRNSASPAANDITGAVNFNGNDSAAGAVTYSQIDSRILDPTNGSEDGELRFRTRIADVNTVGLSLANGVQIGAPTSGYMGSGTLNLDNALYRDGVQLLATRVTGWAAATNTKSKATFDTTTVTLPQLASRVGQLIDDLIAHGLIGT